MKKLYYIKERMNPQTGTYYVAEGALSKTAAKRNERPLYGRNIMHGFENESDYLAEIERLKASGERFL